MVNRYRVIANHPAYPQYVDVVSVHPSTYPGGVVLYYATGPLLGCGKDYETEYEAIVGLLRDHAYFKISAVLCND